MRNYYFKGLNITQKLKEMKDIIKTQSETINESKITVDTFKSRNVCKVLLKYLGPAARKFTYCGSNTNVEKTIDCKYNKKGRGM